MEWDRRKLVIAGAGLLLLLAIVVGLLRAHRAARVVPVTTVGYAPFAIELPERGVVQYPQIQTMSSQVGGNVGRVFVAAGERVIAGQTLVTIENPQIIANARSSEAAYRSATARAESAEVTGGSNVAEAQANLEAARARMAQAQQDVANGLQSGLGYGETTATVQRAQADANLATAATALREAQRLYFAYRDLYGSKAVSHDQLDQSEAKYEEAQVAYGQARLQRASLGTQLMRSRAVLADNLRSAQEGFAQAHGAVGDGARRVGGRRRRGRSGGSRACRIRLRSRSGTSRCHANSSPLRCDGLERCDRKERSAAAAPARRRRRGGSAARDARRETIVRGEDESGRARRRST